MKTTSRFASSAGGLALAAVLACAGPGLPAAHAQSSSAHALAPGSLMAAGGAESTATHVLVGGMEACLGQARGSSAAHDIVPGIVGGAFSSQVTMVLTTTANTYAGVAVPLTGSSTLVTSVLHQFGAYDNKWWRFGHWSPADSAYQEPGTTLNLTTVGTGLGYWLITKDASSDSVTGLPAPVLPDSMALLTHGSTGAWNQIGNPFLFAVSASALQVTDGTHTYTLTDAGNTLTDNVVKGWTAASGYANVTVLNPQTAYWVHTKSGVSNVKLVVPYVATTPSPIPALLKPAGADWAVAVLARQGEQACEPVLVGATSLPAGPANPLNLTAAPLPLGGRFLVLTVPRPDWGGEYVRQFQPQAERMAWDLTVAGGEAPGEIRLELRGFDVPAGTRFTLTDHATGVVREVAPGDVVTLAAGASARSLHLEATAAGATPPPATVVADALRHAYPNPFAGRVGLTFALARRGDIGVDIFDLAGRRVCRLEQLAQGPGEHVLVWDGRDASGQPVRSGVYLARYRAGSAHGATRLVRIE